MAESNQDNKNAGGAAGKQKAKAAASVGRTVRYVVGPGNDQDGPDVRAAHVAAVEDAGTGRLTLAVIKTKPTDLLGHTSSVCGGGTASAITLLGGVEFDPEGKPGTWHWPAKDE